MVHHLHAIPPALAISLDIQRQVRDTRRNDQLLAPELGPVLRSKRKAAVLELLRPGDGRVPEADARVPRLEVGSGFGAQRRRVGVVVAHDVVHVLGAGVAVDPRVDDQRRVELAGESCCRRESCRAATDDKDVVLLRGHRVEGLQAKDVCRGGLGSSVRRTVWS